VLPLLGITSDFGRYTSLVSPWLENGSLMQYLDKNSDSLGAGPRLQLACEVAAGLSYLHSSHVVHGDLTGANVLITDQGKACLCDFGLSTLMIAFHGTSFYISTVGGNARWAAPEIYRVTDDDEVERSVTVQSDVYSFGCIMLEIFSGQVPYHYLVREAQVLMELQNGNRPRRPNGECITDTLWDIINACWADKPNDRPAMEKVGRYIKHQLILETLPC
jgi:serine/threonine protein kinase